MCNEINELLFFNTMLNSSGGPYQEMERIGNISAVQFFFLHLENSDYVAVKCMRMMCKRSLTWSGPNQTPNNLSQTNHMFLKILVKPLTCQNHFTVKYVFMEEFHTCKKPFQIHIKPDANYSLTHPSSIHQNERRATLNYRQK